VHSGQRVVVEERAIGEKEAAEVLAVGDRISPLFIRAEVRPKGESFCF
jgi:hypothetical protein